MGNDTAKNIGYILQKKNLTLSLAESCTGGLVSDAITDIPGSSEYFKGSVIAYSNDIKKEMLNVPGDVIKKYGAVSEMTSKFMAEGVKDLLNTEISASITGIAGPSGGSEQKPVGLAYVSVSTKGQTITREIHADGNRKQIKHKFCQELLKIIEENI